jgi:hypothetical protein
MGGRRLSFAMPKYSLHSGSALLRCVIGCSLLFTPPPTYGSDATGTVRFVSCEVLNQLRLELVRFQKKNLENGLAFRLPMNLETHKNEWMEVGMDCPQRGRCETVRGRIQILHVSYGRRIVTALFGNFAVTYIDGRKLEGSFSAKGIQPSEEIICE